MGNTVSAAEMAATQILHPNTTPSNFKYDYANIPAECPMHKQLHSECPVNNGDINPLNMVCGCCSLLELACPRFVLLDACGQSRAIARSTVSITERTSDFDHSKSRGKRRRKSVLDVPEPANVLECNVAEGLAVERRGHNPEGHGSHNQNTQCK